MNFSRKTVRKHETSDRKTNLFFGIRAENSDISIFDCHSLKTAKPKIQVVKLALIRYLALVIVIMNYITKIIYIVACRPLQKGHIQKGINIVFLRLDLRLGRFNTGK